MKVEQKSPEFEPVSLILETQEEVDALYVILGKTAEGDSGIALYDTWIELELYVSREPTIKADAQEFGLTLRSTR